MDKINKKDIFNHHHNRKLTFMQKIMILVIQRFKQQLVTMFKYSQEPLISFKVITHFKEEVELNLV